MNLDPVPLYSPSICRSRYSCSTNLVSWDSSQPLEYFLDVSLAGRRICHFWRVVSARHDVILGRVAKAGTLQAASAEGSLQWRCIREREHVTSATRNVQGKRTISRITETRTRSFYNPWGRDVCDVAPDKMRSTLLIANACIISDLPYRSRSGSCSR